MIFYNLYIIIWHSNILLVLIRLISFFSMPTSISHTAAPHSLNWLFKPDRSTCSQPAHNGTVIKSTTASDNCDDNDALYSRQIILRAITIPEIAPSQPRNWNLNSRGE